MSERPTTELIRRAPKVLLHDHLDGGLRPATIVELAAEHGYTGLPTTDPDDPAAGVHAPPRRGPAAAHDRGARRRARLHGPAHDRSRRPRRVVPRQRDQPQPRALPG